MKRIGLLSDTHAHWDDRYLHHFEECDEIWHAVTLESSFSKQTTCERMSHYAVIPLKYPHRPVHKPREKEGSKVQLVDSQMIKNLRAAANNAQMTDGDRVKAARINCNLHKLCPLLSLCGKW